MDISRLKTELSRSESMINRNNEIIQCLTSIIDAPKFDFHYDENKVLQMAKDIFEDYRNIDEDQGDDVDVIEDLTRMFHIMQTLPVLVSILSQENDKNRGHSSFETCREYTYWILGSFEPHECMKVMKTDSLLRELSARIGCERVMMYNPLYFKRGYKTHSTCVDLKVRIAEFMLLIKSPVEFTTVYYLMGLM